ncbi:tripartite tricarboxylate transporter TctB family protein [Kribbella sp. NPDC004875]|uniref:tripartite tricarboxylate transporter TctB family protein n=1 Tax=Kribbella sp. NPDC004875 TaxID=3364107 RepID=UPI00368B56A1
MKDRRAMETLTDTRATATDPPPHQRRPAGTWAVQAVLAAVGGYVAISARGLGVWLPEGPGPGFFPLVLAVALVLLSVVWFFQTPRLEAVPTGDERTPWRAAGVTLASLVVLAVVLQVLGFQVSLCLFLLFHLRWIGKVRWLTTVIVAVVGSVGTFHLFNDLLLVPLPVATVPPLTLIGI